MLAQRRTHRVCIGLRLEASLGQRQLIQSVLHLAQGVLQGIILLADDAIPQIKLQSSSTTI